jgi:hypothetical protein
MIDIEWYFVDSSQARGVEQDETDQAGREQRARTAGGG